MEDAGTAELLVRLVVSLAVVFGLMAVAGRVAKRRGLGTTRTAGSADRIEVLARHGFGRTSSVAVVRVAGRTLVLGIGEASVTLLAEDDTPPAPAEVPEQRTPLSLGTAEPSSPFDWSSIVESLKDRTARRT